MTTTPPSLLHQLRSAPDARSWGDFVELYTPILFDWANRFARSEPDAADLVQEVFVVLVRKLPEFDYDRTRSFRGWLKTILLNLWRNQVKGAVRAEAAHAELANRESPPDDDPGEREFRAEVTRRALALMRAEFSEPTWRACWMVVVEDRSAAEVAGQLGLTENAVYLARGRVLARLRLRLQGMLD